MDLSRRANIRHSKNAYLVVCSSAHEEHYLHWMIRVLEHSHVHVYRVPDATPGEMIEAARRLADDARSKSSTYDEVWCILTAQDLDDDLLHAAETGRIRLARTWPTFELWLLLHFLKAVDEVRASNCSGVTADLQAYMPELDVAPTQSLELLAGRYETARRLALSLPSDQGDAVAQIYDLVDSIRESLHNFYADGKIRAI